MYISQPYILELGLKPDLVYNPRRVASTANSLPFISLIALFILVLFLCIALQIRRELLLPIEVTISFSVLC